MGPLPGKVNRVEARAAKVPRQVAKIAEETAMISELVSARRRVAFSHIWANHSVVNPFSGKAMIVPELKAKSGKRMIGA